MPRGLNAFKRHDYRALLVDHKSLPAREKVQQAILDAKLPPDFLPGIAQQGKRQAILLSEFTMGFFRIRTYTDHQNPGFGEILITVPEGAGFSCTARCKILGIEKNYQGLLPNMIAGAKPIPFLVPQGECGYGASYRESHLPACIGYKISWGFVELYFQFLLLFQMRPELVPNDYRYVLRSGIEIPEFRNFLV